MKVLQKAQEQASWQPPEQNCHSRKRANCALEVYCDVVWAQQEPAKASPPPPAVTAPEVRTVLLGNIENSGKIVAQGGGNIVAQGGGNSTHPTSQA